MLGDPAVGKTSLIRKYVLDKFDDRYLMTVGTKVTKKVMNIDSFPDRSIRLTLMIWDILGQKKYRKLHSTFYKLAKGALVICDITREETLESIPGWIKGLYRVTGEIPTVICANKIDLEDQYEFTPDEARAFGDELGHKVFLTSAKTGENVEDAFQQLGHYLVKS